MCAQADAKQKYKAGDGKSKGAPLPAAVSATNVPPSAPLVVVTRKVTSSAPVTFRKATLNKTRHSPPGQGIMAAMDTGADDEISRQGNVTRKTGTVFLRIGLRTASASGQVRGANVMVQLFGTDLAAVKKIMPVQAVMHETLLAQLDDEDVFLVYPPVTFRCEKMPSRESGQEFYGVALTVFDSGGAILYQGVTRRSLESFVATALP